MSGDFVIQPRWKVCKRVHSNDLATRLMSLTSKGWQIRDIFRWGLGYYSIVAFRTVKVRV